MTPRGVGPPGRERRSGGVSDPHQLQPFRNGDSTKGIKPIRRWQARRRP